MFISEHKAGNKSSASAQQIEPGHKTLLYQERDEDFLFSNLRYWVVY